jgi:hypothetical protein
MFETGIVATNTGAADNGFISNILGSFQTGLQKIGSDILPNWAASQLGVQQTPILDNPTLNQSALAPRADGTTDTTAKITPTLWDQITKQTNVSSGAVVMIGVVLIGLAFAVKIIRK